MHRPKPNAGNASARQRVSFAIKDWKPQPGFGSWENPIGDAGLVLEARPEIRELVVTEIEQVEIESVGLRYRRVFDTHRKTRGQLSVGSLAARDLGVQQHHNRPAGREEFSHLPSDHDAELEFPRPPNRSGTEK